MIRVVHARTLRALSAYALFIWLASACTLIAPLEDVRPTSAKAAPGKANPGTKSPQAPSADGSVDAMQAPAMSDEDAGPKPRACKPLALTPCNPIEQCGCPQGDFCTLDDAETAIKCVADSGGSKQRGEPCKVSSDCAAGLQCPETRRCAPYCATDTDCESGETCMPFTNQDLGRTVMGSGACHTTCDPVSGEPCPDNTRCASSFEDYPWQRAICISTDGLTLGNRGESCEAFEAVCAPKFACARFGAEVCAPFCRTNADCPKDAPRCYIEDRLAAPGDRVGECSYESCDDKSVPVPAWTGDPVATATEFGKCRGQCGQPSNNLFCVQANCVKDLDRCLRAALGACAAAKDGPCRAEYVKANCVNWKERYNRTVDYDNCAAKHDECAMQAQKACVKP